ncbi:hypothetical protein HPB49_019853 [Dermacentor silvarum]|uniref:Uncharacterized protein n=1 Tax=Dermacentor silvarum TaxID=543639 RepID=A0ACB8DFD0_DERSI|nr:hypothetical protein HPB49_019853 [Dermacentor silvarum]
MAGSKRLSSSCPSPPWQEREMSSAAVTKDFRVPVSEARDCSLAATVVPSLPRLLLLDSPPEVPLTFGYDTTDEFGTQLFHKEQGDASNAKTGSYGYRDANGLFRTVKYVADANGFRATIDTNEPGTAPGASADAVFNANPVAAPAGAGKGGAGRYGGAKAAAYGAGAGGPWAG